MYKLFFTFFITTMALAQYPKSDWAKENLNGKVRSITTYTYKCELKDGKTIKGERMENFNNSEEFDNQGFKISGKRFLNDNKVTGNWKYTYNEKKQLTQVQVFDANNTLQEVLKYSYEEQTKREEILGYDTKNNLSGKQIAIYNDKGNKISELSLDGKNEFLLKLENKYNEKQQLIQKDFEDKQGRKVTLKYVYDLRGNIIEENYYGEGNQLYGQKIFTYKYDKSGNWIERIEVIYGIERILTERKIQYF